MIVVPPAGYFSKNEHILKSCAGKSVAYTSWVWLLTTLEKSTNTCKVARPPDSKNYSKLFNIIF